MKTIIIISTMIICFSFFIVTHQLMTTQVLTTEVAEELAALRVEQQASYRRDQIVEERYYCILGDPEQRTEWLAWCREQAAAEVVFSTLSREELDEVFQKWLNSQSH